MATSHAVDVEEAAGSAPIGLLVVHGIGRQTRGATATGIIKGLQATYGGGLKVCRISPNHFLVRARVRQCT
jgi:hypothetical protein